MHTVELERYVNELMDLYFDLYKQKYAIPPVIQNQGEANTILRDIIRNVGMPRAKAIVNKYLSTDGDNSWFLRQGHSLGVLKKNLEAVNSATGQRAQATQTMAMKIHLSCDRCKAFFDWIGTAEELERTRLCGNCKGPQ